VIIDDKGGRMFVCSDTDYCESRQAAGHHGSQRAPDAYGKSGAASRKEQDA